MSDLFLASYVVLWLLTVATIVVLLGTARQVGLMTKRFPFDDALNETGPKLGSRLAGVVAERVTTRDSIRLEPQFPARTTMVFVEESCSVCERIIPAVAEIVDEAPESDFWIVYEAAPPSLADDLAPIADRVVVSAEAFREWGIAIVPYVCIVSTGGIVEAKGQLLHTGRLREELGLPIPETHESAEPSEVSREEAPHEYERA